MKIIGADKADPVSTYEVYLIEYSWNNLPEPYESSIRRLSQQGFRAANYAFASIASASLTKEDTAHRIVRIVDGLPAQEFTRKIGDVWKATRENQNRDDNIHILQIPGTLVPLISADKTVLVFETHKDLGDVKNINRAAGNLTTEQFEELCASFLSDLTDSPEEKILAHLQENFRNQDGSTSLSNPQGTDLFDAGFFFDSKGELQFDPEALQAAVPVSGTREPYTTTPATSVGSGTPGRVQGQ